MAVHFTREDAIALYMEIACSPPEESGGSLRNQIAACKSMYCTLGYEPALQRLHELAQIDASRTRGKRRGQETAEKLLKNLLPSIKVDKNKGIQ